MGSVLDSYGRTFFKDGHDEGWRHYAVCFDKPGIGILIMTNSSNGEGIYKELLETLLKNTFTPIEWEQFTPYNQLPPRPPLKQHKEVAVDPKLLDKLVGRYEVNPDTMLAITREGNRLFCAGKCGAEAGVGCRKRNPVFLQDC
jgi:hypothetical protein